MLRPYQLDAIVRLRAAYAAGAKSVCLVMPTGSGKTQVAAEIIRGANARGNRVAFLVDRTVLVEQTVARLGFAGVRVIHDGGDTGRPDALVLVGSVQTLRQSRWDGQLPDVQLVIADECHHFVARSYTTVLSRFPGARLLGLSATPERRDGKPLGDVFEQLVIGPSIRELTDLGHLVPCRIIAPRPLASGELALAPLDAYRRYAGAELTSIYCRDLAHARAELALFEAAGVPSAMVWGGMPARARESALAAWADGATRAMFSVGCLTEGFDLPRLSCAILARRVTHPGLYLQIGGRILRPAPGKSSALMVDLTGCAQEHGPLELDRAYSLTGQAITTVDRTTFGQCAECGSMFIAGPRTCPFCGAAIQVRPAKPHRVVDAELSELERPKTPRAPWVSRLLARHDGTCSVCRKWFPRGTAIFYTSGQPRSARHQRCP